mmetsp:Transcript_24804/g.44118  ORF Transcript_24804/g.44118 Transcript_24804/m.44118 type:complete len:141 (+) Transcript_24804:565-987(+)
MEIHGDSVEEILYNVVLEIPEEEYILCPVARLFRCMVKNLKRNKDGFKRIELSTEAEELLSPDIGEIYPSKTPEHSPRHSDAKQHETKSNLLGNEKSVAMEWLGRMGFSRECIRDALEAERGEAEKAVERLLSAKFASTL